MAEGEGDAAERGEGMLIDELARRAGVTSRNIRAYQSRGILPRPTIRGRVGVYDKSHLARLRVITRLREEGFSLAGVAKLIEAWEQGSSLADLLGVDEDLSARWGEDVSEIIDEHQLARMFPFGGELEQRQAIEGGLVVPEGDHYWVPSPVMLRIGTQLAVLGVPFSAVVTVTQDVRERADQTAVDVIELFERHVWDPFEASGADVYQLRASLALLHELRRTAFEAVTRAVASSLEVWTDRFITRRLRVREVLEEHSPKSGNET